MRNNFRAENQTTDQCNEDKGQYDEKRNDYSDEEGESYEDEDGSMEPSDNDCEPQAETGISGDTIEDVMNIPGKTAPPASIQTFQDFDLHDSHTSEVTREWDLYRESIEKRLTEERLKQEQRQATAAKDNIYGYTVTCDWEKCSGSNRSKDLAFQALQEVGMCSVGDDDGVASELEVCMISYVDHICDLVQCNC